MASAGVTVPLHFICLSAVLHEDLAKWAEFLDLSLVLEDPLSNRDLELYTDVPEAYGFKAYFQGTWCAEGWPAVWRDWGCCSSLALLKLFPILVAM